MTIAEIHGKLSPHEAGEDLLTSDVFGACKYLPPELGLIPFLSQAVNSEGESMSHLLQNTQSVEYYFWPKTTKLRRESDIVIILHKENEKNLVIVVECKYHSTKHNIEGEAETEKHLDEESRRSGDQLADQYDEICKNNIALDQQALNAVKSSGENKYLVYVTAHYAFPSPDIQETENELLARGYDEKQLKNLYWVSWRSAYAAFKHVKELLDGENKSKETYPKNLVLDTIKLLERKGLVPLTGFHKLKLNITSSVLPENFFWEKQFWGINVDNLQLNNEYFFWRDKK